MQCYRALWLKESLEVRDEIRLYTASFFRLLRNSAVDNSILMGQCKSVT